jgi:hypothetical protein
MLGWWIRVKTQGPGAPLAQWEVSGEGLAWIERLVEAGKATRHRNDGYPNSYTARAGDVLPLIENGRVRPHVLVFGLDEGEEYAQESWMGDSLHLALRRRGEEYAYTQVWIGKMEINADRMAACPDDSLLLIIAYDLS